MSIINAQCVNHASFFPTRLPPRAQSREEKAGELLIGICGVMFDLSLRSLLETKKKKKERRPGCFCARQTLVLNTDPPIRGNVFRLFSIRTER